MKMDSNGIQSSAYIKKYVLSAGATVVGIAPAFAFNDAPIGHRASDIIPDAKSVIVFGIKLYDKGCRICIDACPYGVFHNIIRFEFAGISHPLCRMQGDCYYNSYACGGTCLQVCPAGTGDKQMKKAIGKRLSGGAL